METVSPWRTWPGIAALVSCGGIAAAVLASIVQIGIAVPVWEHWNFIPILDAFYSGQPWFRLVWEPFFGHLAAVPMLIEIGLARLTSWDVMAEMYLGWAFVAVAVCFMIVWAGRLRIPVSLRGLLAVAAALLMFNVRSGEVLYNGFNSCVFVCYFFVALSIALLAVPAASPMRVVGAAACAMLATWSWGAGFAMWVAGGVALLLHERPKKIIKLSLWGIAGSAAALLALRSRAGAPPSVRGITLERVLVLLSNPFDATPARVPGLLMLGAAFFLLGSSALARRSIAPRRDGSLPFVMLFSHGLVALSLVMVVRGPAADFNAAEGRYCFVVGSMLVGALGCAVTLVWSLANHAADSSRRRWGIASASVLVAAVGSGAAVGSWRSYRLVVAADSMRESLERPFVQNPYEITPGQFMGIAQVELDKVVRGLEVMRRWRLGPFHAATPPSQALATRALSAPLGSELTLHVNSVARLSNAVEMKGWAFAGPNQEALAAVIVRDQDGFEEHADLGPWSGVPAELLPRAASIGWRICVPLAELDHLRHEPSVWGLSHDGHAINVRLELAGEIVREVP